MLCKTFEIVENRFLYVLISFMLLLSAMSSAIMVAIKINFFGSIFILKFMIIIKKLLLKKVNLSFPPLAQGEENVKHLLFSCMNNLSLIHNL